MTVIDKRNKEYELEINEDGTVNIFSEEGQNCNIEVSGNALWILKNGDCNFMDTYINISQKCTKFGTMEITEFKNYISDYAIKDGKILGNTQLSFF